MTDERKLKSYVWHDGKCYYVSTIIRDSSASISPPPRYAETGIWEYDWDTSTRGVMVGLTGDGEAFRQHFSVCEQLFRTGQYKDQDE